MTTERSGSAQIASKCRPSLWRLRACRYSPTLTGGFTLVELIAALTVGGMIVAAVFVGIKAVTDWQLESRWIVRTANRDAAVRWQLADWLRAAYVGPENRAGEFVFRNRMHDTLPDDELAWSTLAASPASQGPTRVRVHVVRPASSSAGVLEARISSPGNNSARSLELASGVQGLDVRFFVRNQGGRWVDEWNSTHQRPGAAEVHLTGDSLSPILRAPIVVRLTGS